MTYEYRYSIAVDGSRFVECNDHGVIGRTIEATLRRGRSDVVEVEDRETGEVETHRVERRITVERRAVDRGDRRR